jgi:hypothetical protein
MRHANCGWCTTELIDEHQPGKTLFCSEQCKEKYREVEKYNHTTPSPRSDRITKAARKLNACTKDRDRERAERSAITVLLGFAPKAVRESYKEYEKTKHQARRTRP